MIGLLRYVLIVSLFITLRGLGRLLNDAWVIGLL